MSSPASGSDRLELWAYRSRVTDIYHRVRTAASPALSWDQWRAGRDELFRSHPQSPIPYDRRKRWTGDYAAYDSAWRLAAVIDPVKLQQIGIAGSGTETVAVLRIGRISTNCPGGALTLDVFWMDDYAGGVFVPIRDTTNGITTYGGGRYLLDTGKGADLGRVGDQVVLDFNFAYHPSCAHDPRWSCPLAPPSNNLAFDVPVGEQLPSRV